MEPLREVVEYYEQYAEESRLQRGPSQLEFERTKHILTAVLPPAPARVFDVGGAAGAYSAWLAALGYRVHLVDASPRLVAEARRRNAALPTPIASLEVADARALPHADASADVVLVMGPLYHLPDAADRAAALREAARVLVPSGLVAVAAISRYASALDGLARGLGADAAFVRIRDRDLHDGQHRNDTGRTDYFTTAFLHRPGDLCEELEGAGFEDVGVYGVEGPGWMVADFDRRWQDPALRRDFLEVAAALEREPSVIGASAHLLGIGRKRPDAEPEREGCSTMVCRHAMHTRTARPPEAPSSAARERDAVIPGLRYLPEYLGTGEHDELLRTVSGLEWRDGGGRRIQFYGHWYDRAKGGLYRVGDLPEWAAALASRLHADELMPYVADQLIVTEYQAGEGIRPHVDAPVFADVIVGVGLGSACVMEFVRDSHSARALLIEPRSAMVLSGEARRDWQHAIPARADDEWQGRTLPRGRRVSLTFRKMLDSGEEASMRKALGP